MSTDERKLYIVCYDISDDKRRTRVHSALTGFGTWVQYSLFECFLDKKQRLYMEARLLKEQRENTHLGLDPQKSYTIRLTFLLSDLYPLLYQTLTEPSWNNGHQILSPQG